MARGTTAFYIQNIQEELLRNPDTKSITVSRSAMSALIRQKEFMAFDEQTLANEKESHRKHISKLKEEIRSWKARAAYYETRYKAMKYDDLQ